MSHTVCVQMMCYVAKARRVALTVRYDALADDDREKRYFSDVKATNHTYIVHPETVALTHVSPEYCQAECGIYDQDVLDDVRP